MSNRLERLERLAHVAHRYYIEDWKQSDIALEIGVSRPMISRMLAEARSLGVVEITIHGSGNKAEAIFRKLREKYSLTGGKLSNDGGGDLETNHLLCGETMDLLKQLNSRRIGIGWGHFIGHLVNWVNEQPTSWQGITNICPLMGNAAVPIRNYQSNENVRLLAHKLRGAPHFLHLPALAESMEEKGLLCSTEQYKLIEEQWGLMDTALVNIGNYPATPDFASGARYGTALQKERACGRLLAYYFNTDGKIITSDQDFAIQIPIRELKHCPNVVGLCSANTGIRALKGALNTGVFTHLVAREALVTELLGT